VAIFYFALLSPTLTQAFPPRKNRLHGWLVKYFSGREIYAGLDIPCVLPNDERIVRGAADKVNEIFCAWLCMSSEMLKTFWREENSDEMVLRHCKDWAKKEGTMNRAPTELNAAR
jgi:hypothetical protein